MEMVWIPIISVLASSVTVIFVVYFVTRGRQRRFEAQVQMQTRLIDRFGSAPELVEFLHSPAGREFVAGVQTTPRAITRDRVMSGFTRAIVLTSLGVAFIALTFMEDRDFAVPATIVFSLGAGYLLATLLTYKLSSKLGTEARES